MVTVYTPTLYSVHFTVIVQCATPRPPRLPRARQFLDNKFLPRALYIAASAIWFLLLHICVHIYIAQEN